MVMGKYLFGGVAAVSAAILSATPARADDIAFLNALNNAGIVVYDTQMAITTGYRICSALAVTNGQDLAYQMYGGPDVPDLPTANAWIVAAGFNLCPWMYHPERDVVSQPVEQPQLKRAT
jgi:hypothetical protein